MNDQVTPAETSEILRLATQCLSTAGDFVELGCYRGDTSVLLGKLLQNSQADVDAQSVENLCKKPIQTVEKVGKTCSKMCKSLCKNLWIYDSFAGLPAKTMEDSSGAGQVFQKGELFVSKREVVEKLRKHGLKIASRLHAPSQTELRDSVVIVKKAWFKDLEPQDLPARIAFAFLDGDLYDSIKTSLQLVVPLLADQGIIIVHDYNNPELPGSARAVDEFLRAHPSYRIAQKHTLAILTRPN